MIQKKQFTQKQLFAYTRAGIQLLFFLFFPSAFTSAFSAIKAMFTQIGSRNPIVWSSFLTVLLALCAYTIVFGRFFCGYACAFGTLGDAVHGLYKWICKKRKKKPIQLPKAWSKGFSFLKYGILFLIVLLCFTGAYGATQGWSPWDVFSRLQALHFDLSGYVGGCILLVGILIGMAVCERFFCRVLCPMGAIFSLLPLLPFFSPRRNREHCIKGCSACERTCPSGITLPDGNSSAISGDCFQCRKCVQICPKKNAKCSVGKFRGDSIWFCLIQAVTLMVVLVLAGVK